MRSRIRAISLAALAIGAASPAGVVVERWGVEGRVQHPGTVRFEPAAGAAGLLFDLSALPPGAAIHRARLFFRRPAPYGPRFVLEPPLPLVPPHFRWFDAKGIVPSGSLLLRSAPDFDRKGTILEIAYEGELRDPPPQARGIRAFFRSGQVFISFREIEDYAGGKGEIAWKELGGRFRDIDVEGPIPRDEGGEIRYRIYEHDEPICASTIGRARLLADVVPGSIYNTRLVPDGDFIAMRPEAIAIRLAIEPGRPLSPGSGLYVHTVDRPGRRWYAVVSAIDGVENTIDFSEENVAGPIEGTPGEPEPVLQALPRAHGHPHAGTTPLGDGAIYEERWYSYWAVPPCAPRPLRYDFAAGFCPRTLQRPAPLTFVRGHTWGHAPEMPEPAPRPGIVMSMSDDPPNGFWTGTNDARGTLKGIEEGAWRPFAQERQEALIRWASRTWEIDPRRIVSSIGAWGMWEIRRGDLYAYIHGWGMPEVTKGFQCWDWARGAWGPPEAYRGKPDAENPYVLQDYARWVLEHPTVELPYVLIHTGWGAHFTEMGWPPFPRFIRAMMDTKRAFAMCHGGPVSRAILEGGIAIARDRSLPAFGTCSLDDNIGDGELGTGKPFGQINGYLLWESDTILDRPDAWEMTIWLDGSAPRPHATVDLTARRTQAFRPAPGELFAWTSGAASGLARADAWGLVTIRGLAVAKEKRRIRIRPVSAAGATEGPIERGGVAIHCAMDFDEGLEGWEAANGGSIRLTEDAVSGRALEVRCEAGWAGAVRPISIRGSRGLKVALRMKGREIPAAGIDVFDAIAGDNTTAYGYRYIRPDRFVPILYRLERFRYNARRDGTVDPATSYTEMRFFGPEEGRPGASFTIDDLVVYRGEDREPPGRVENLRARASAEGVRLSWDPAPDNVGAATYVIARADGDGPFAKIAEACETRLLDAAAPKGMHRYRVFAIDAEENAGAWSEAVEAATSSAGRPPEPSREGRDRLGYAARIREVHARGAGKVRRNHAALFGDSLTGATVYPQCAEAAFGTLTVDAYGYASMTTRFGREKVGEILRDANPEFLFVLFGTNDDKSPEEIARAMEDLAAVADACEAHGTIPVLGTIPPRGWDPASAPEARYNEALVELCRRRRIPIAYIFEDWQAAGDRRRYMGEDGVHWKAEGMEIAARAWAKALAEIRFAIRDRP